MPRDASELARRLARDAEAVCRHYLSNGRRQGRYWTVGDVRNTPGRSMFVRLSGPESGPGAAGRWTNSASTEYGDLLDVIRESCGFIDFRDVVEEARRFLSLPRAEPGGSPKHVCTPVPTGSPEAARRLFAVSRPIRRTLVEIYLRNRGIRNLRDACSLQFHPRCYYRPEGDGPTETWPAMIAAVTDLSGAITGVHRTWLSPDGSDKAPIETQRGRRRRRASRRTRRSVSIAPPKAGGGTECARPKLSVHAAPTPPVREIDKGRLDQRREMVPHPAPVSVLISEDGKRRKTQSGVHFGHSIQSSCHGTLFAASVSRVQGCSGT